MSTKLDTPEGARVTFRRMEFGFDRLARQHWFDDNPFLTHFFNALSASFPEGEQFFIDSVRHYEPQVQDPTLRAQIRGFVRQEGHHTHQHRLLNDRIRARGVPLSRCDPWVGLQARRKADSPRLQLACTCAMEHFTALIGHWLLTRREIVDKMDPEIAALWRWHSVEEIEHKAVAFDTYQHTGGDYRTRILGMVMATYNFLPRLHMMQLILLRADPAPLRWPHVRDGLRVLYGNNGIIRSMLLGIAHYYRRDFHPWQHDNSALIAQWERRDAEGVLVESALA
jgi:uncharacterized protein